VHDVASSGCADVTCEGYLPTSSIGTRMTRELRLGLTTLTVVFGVLVVLVVLESLDAIMILDAAIMAALCLAYAVVAVYGGRPVASTVYETLSSRINPSAAAVVTGVVAVLLLMTGLVVVAALLRFAAVQRARVRRGS
jgi:hypothetical protein